ncbi:MAG: hypothetical protein KDD43_00045 [Bdellovibrionales bacterium]|nr:hypothetical protein [Bdellovibrionales bacterium]
MPTFQTAYGVRYKGKKQSDGTYLVKSVPWFSETFDNRDGTPYDGEFMRRAYETLKGLEQKGHFKAIHLDHHDSSQSKRNVGILTNWELRDYDGYGLTLFADMARLPGDVYDKLKDGRIPYRSAEIPDIEAFGPSLSSGALLETQDPYHEYPNFLGIEEEDIEEVELVGAGTSALFCKAGERTFAIFPYEKEITMPTKAKDKKNFEGGGNPAPPAAPPAQPAQQPAQPAVDINQLAAQVAELQKQVQQLIAGNPNQPAQQPVPTQGGGAQMNKGESAEFSKMKKALGEVTAELAILKGVTSDQVVKDQVDTLMTQLDDEGYEMDPAQRQFIKKNAEAMAKVGEEAIQGFFQTLQVTLKKKPNFTPDPRMIPRTHKSINKFQGTDHEQLAKQALVKWESNPQIQKAFSGTREDYIQSQIDLATGFIKG